MYSIQRTIAPTVEPVTLDQAKSHLRVESDDDDALIATYIQAAREYVEQQTNRAVLQQTWRLSLDCFPQRLRCPVPPGVSLGTSCRIRGGILLPKPALIAVTSITYLDYTGSRQTLDPSMYSADAGLPAMLAPAYGTYWPAAAPQPGSVQVTYTAGYGSTATAVPATVQLAVLVLTTQFYDNRDVVIVPGSPTALTVDSLLASETVPAFTFES